ncbi:MAG: AAA family ATPase [Candidatus Eremiobacteraeota bacterium]|nr:AAA family ATPase [Candidatus Eremiobacteraeota bacterium]
MPTSGRSYRQRIPGTEIPAALLDAFKRNQCVLFAGERGPGMFCDVTRAQVIRVLTQQVVENSPSLAADTPSEDELDDDPEYGADFVRRFCSPELVRRTLDDLRETRIVPADTAKILHGRELLRERVASLPFRACVTTAIDRVVADVFAGRSPAVIDGARNDEIDTIFSTTAFVLARLNGSAAAPDTVRLSTEELRRFAYANPVFAKAIASMFANATVFFLGTTADEIIDVVSAFPDLADLLALYGPHFLVSTGATKQEQGTRRHARRLERYGIETVETGRRDVTGVGLPHALSVALHSTATEPADTAAPTERMRRLTLTNIGPFEQISIPFSPGWNVILGDNGVGKSTILRAVALALCGDAQASSFAGKRLLRSGADSGQIQLQLDAVTHATTLLRQTDGSVHVSARLISPVQQGTWAVLGFPPMRGISMRAMSPSSTQFYAPAGGRPRVEDLLPLLVGSVDTRIDDLRDWLVLLEFAKHGEAIRATFFEIAKELFTDATVAFASGDPASGVMVETADGVVPIEQLSQGMISLLAWVGILVQRMHEIYPDDNAPLERSALVLVDEIDAHLHPAWQRALVPVISKRFPNLQLVATTHSPLVVTALKREDILIARRAGARVEVVAPQGDIEGRQAEDAYRSELFGMTTTRPVRTVEQLDRYAVLLNMSSRTHEEETEFAVLHDGLFPTLRTEVPTWQIDVDDADLSEIEAILDAPDARERLRTFFGDQVT